MVDDQNELFVVVDADDNIIGYRSRYDCHHDKTLIHRTAGVLLFDGDRFLLQKRSEKKDMQPGRWGISAAGHVGKGESYEETALREMKEEIGITVSSLQFVKTFLMKATRETEMATIFFYHASGPFHFTPDKDEVSEVRFFTKEEMRDAIAANTIELTECALETMKQIGMVK